MNTLLKDWGKNLLVEMRELRIDFAFVWILENPFLPVCNHVFSSTKQSQAATCSCMCRFNEATSRRRKRHCRPRFVPGRAFFRANSLTVSGLRSSISAACRLLSRVSSFSPTAAHSFRRESCVQGICHTH